MAHEFSDDLTSVDCAFPSDPVTLVDADGAVLKVWSFTLDEDVHTRVALPDDPDLLAYRAAMRGYGGSARTPPLEVPAVLSDAEAKIWEDEAYNNNLVYQGKVGSIVPISCLDALLFAEQNTRLSQLTDPTEFIASVLRRKHSETHEVVVIFGAGSSLFPPKSVYGLDVVADYVGRGWSYWYMLHNHTPQQSGGRVVPGVPAPSMSDIHFAQNLAEKYSLESIRVTNGIYTFSATVDALIGLRQR
jgi:hypothetical protein